MGNEVLIPGEGSGSHPGIPVVPTNTQQAGFVWLGESVPDENGQPLAIQRYWFGTRVLFVWTGGHS